jgi:hypothetical protein
MVAASDVSIDRRERELIMRLRVLAGSWAKSIVRV